MSEFPTKRLTRYCGKWIIVATMLLFCCTPLYPQPEENVPFNEILREILNDIPEGLDYSELYDRLSDLHNNPVSLNTASADDLQKLFFLSTKQVNDILSYREKYGAFLSLYELKDIPSIDDHTLRILLLFVSADPAEKNFKIKFKDLAQKGDNQIQLRFKEILEKQKGYSVTDSAKLAGQNYYMGNRMGLFFRYDYTLKSRISYGFVAEKDPGEELFKGSHKKGFDFYSTHFFLKGTKKLKALAIGDYQANFGQGLTFWSGISFRSNADQAGIYKSGEDISTYKSSNESNYLRGMACTYGLENIKISLFYSNKKIDANILNPDSVSGFYNSYFTSMTTSGYHRTPNETESWHSVREQMTGGHVSWNTNHFKMGFTMVKGWFSQPFEKKKAPADFYDFEGSSFLNSGVDYAIPLKTFFIFGEMGFDGSCFANLTGILMDFTSRLSGVLVYRNYPAAFHALFSNAFRSGSECRNEKGLFLSLLYNKPNKWKVNVEADQCRYPWLKYRVDQPSTEYKFNLKAETGLLPKNMIKLKFSLDNKEVNSATDENSLNILTTEQKESVLFEIISSISENTTSVSGISYVHDELKGKDVEQGLITCLDMTHQFFTHKLFLTFGFYLFNTDGYRSIIYYYEDNLPGSISTPGLYGHGARCHLLVGARYFHQIDLLLKLDREVYTDQISIGSGLDQIQSNHKTGIHLSLNYRF